MDMNLCNNDTKRLDLPRPLLAALLTESLFPPRKPDTHNGVNVDGLSLQSKKDPLATSVWRLYTKAKDTIPNATRLENLTWRKMAMTLKKKSTAAEKRIQDNSVNTKYGKWHGYYGTNSITIPVESDTDEEMTFQPSGMTYSSHSVPPALFPRLCYTDSSDSGSSSLKALVGMYYRQPATGLDAKKDTTCNNCGTGTTPLWRRDPDGQPLCNACGLFLKLHGVVRPLSLKTDNIKKRNRTSQNNKVKSGVSTAAKRGLISLSTDKEPALFADHALTKRQRHPMKTASMTIAASLPEQHLTSPFRALLLRQHPSCSALSNKS